MALPLLALVLALLAAPIMASPTDPTAVHFAYSGNLTEMVISWMTMDQTNSVVKYGLNATDLTMNATGEQVTYGAKLGFQHHTLLHGLQAGTRYHFSCGSNQGWSAVHSFVTPPAAFEPAHIPIFGDLGPINSNLTRKTLEKYLEQNPVDFIYHIGDISYANDYEAAKYEFVWNNYFETMQPIMTKVPYMTCVGNHECNGGKGSDWHNFRAYNFRFRMPRNEHNSNSNMFFSWNYKNIHFVSISSETDFPGSPEGHWASFGPQIKWLEADLASVDRREYPWLIVVGHRPIYSSTDAQTAECKTPKGPALALQKAMEDMFAKYKVDFYFCGHVHSYERAFPVYKNVPHKDYPDHSVMHNPPHTIYIVSGAGGSREGFTRDFCKQGTGWWASVYDQHFGFGVLSVLNNTAVEWKFYRSNDGGVQDKLLVTKG